MSWDWKECTMRIHSSYMCLVDQRALCSEIKFCLVLWLSAMDGRDVSSLPFISQGHDYLWLLGTHFFPHYAQGVQVVFCLFFFPCAQFHSDNLLFPYVGTAFLCHFCSHSNRLSLLLQALPDKFHSQTVDEGCLLKTCSTDLFGFWLVITWKNSTTECALFR